MSYSIIGEQILKFRKEKGLTQRELGDVIGVSSSAVSQWESGGTPDISLLPALSDTLGVTVDALFGRTEAKRENMEEIVGQYIASLPEDKRLERLISIIRKAVLTGCIDKVAGVVDVDCRDSEMMYISRDGFVTAFLSGEKSFISAARSADGLFDDLLSVGDGMSGLFSVLSAPHALDMLSSLYRESPKYRTAGVLAHICGITEGDAEEILQKFTELRLTKSLELETEGGAANAYAVNLTGTVVPLILSAQLMTESAAVINITADRRDAAPPEVDS